MTETYRIRTPEEAAELHRLSVDRFIDEFTKEEGRRLVENRRRQQAEKEAERKPVAVVQR